jgi:hypothetical protein
MKTTSFMPLLLSIAIFATDAVALTIVPASCETPSLSVNTQQASWADSAFFVFQDWAPDSVNNPKFVRLVDCNSNHSLSVSTAQMAFAEVGAEPTHRSGSATVAIMVGAMKSEEVYTLRSVRDLIRAKGGDGLLMSVPVDYCGCNLVSHEQAGASQ